jgi:uncharacterized coiled-coil protein SlyX
MTPLEERVAALERHAEQRDRALHDLAGKVRAAERVAMRTDERLAALQEQFDIEGGKRR